MASTFQNEFQLLAYYILEALDASKVISSFFFFEIKLINELNEFFFKK